MCNSLHTNSKTDIPSSGKAWKVFTRQRNGALYPMCKDPVRVRTGYLISKDGWVNWKSGLRSINDWRQGRHASLWNDVGFCLFTNKRNARIAARQFSPGAKNHAVKQVEYHEALGTHQETLLGRKFIGKDGYPQILIVKKFKMPMVEVSK